MERFKASWSIWAASAVLAALVACSRGPQGHAEMAASAPAEAADAAAGVAPLPAVVPMDVPASEEQQAAKASVDDAGDTAGGSATAFDERPVDASQFTSTTGTAGDARRKFVRTASARFGVEDVYAAAMAIEDAAATEGGFVTANRIGAQVRRTHERRLGDGRVLQVSEIATTGQLVVRVPGDRSQAFLRGIAKHVAFLDERDFKANDVQFELLRRDLAARRAAQLQADVARAGQAPGRIGAKVDAAVVRSDALAERDEALISGRQLEDEVEFATLRIELHQPVQVRRTYAPDVDRIVRDAGPGFFARVGDAVGAGWRGLLEALVLAATLWPLWLLLAAAVAAARWLRRRQLAARSKAPPSPQ